MCTGEVKNALDFEINRKVKRIKGEKMNQADRIEKIIDEMSIEDLCGQLINFNVSGKIPYEEFEELVKRIRPGGIFVSRMNADEIRRYTDIVNKYTKVPVIVSADIEHGPGCCLWNAHALPEPMAWGACDDAELIKKAGQVTAEICRKNGIHWNFAPIVDINYNKDNPVTNTRAISDSPKQVVKIAGAFVEGMQTNGLMIAGCKHFPGDGMDDRNQHFCTTINPLTKGDWMNTYGYVFKKMFEIGSASVMVGHIALPAVEDIIDPILGPKPGSLSKNVMTKLLREELGYKGCIVSDAMAMVGACSMCPIDKLAIEFINAGGDMILFALENDFIYLRDALLSGEIAMGRVKDAVRHILKMKLQARLFEDQEALVSKIQISGDIKKIAAEVAEKSIKIVRNSENLLPLKLREKARILIIKIQVDEQNKINAPYNHELTMVEEELKKRGYEVDSIFAIGMNHHWLESHRDSYDCILINCRISARDYLSGTLRINRDNIMPFWRGAVINHPCVIFTSFGDPYKLYDLPFLKTYINAFSSSEDTQRAFVEVLLGEKTSVAKNPVTLKGFYEREV